MFGTSLLSAVLKSSLVKMLAKKAVVDNQANAYIMRTSVRGLSGVVERGCTGRRCKLRIGTFSGGKSEIQDVRRRSYAPDRPEYDAGILSVAALVCDHNGLMLAKLAIVAPSVSTNGMKLRNLISKTLDSDVEMSGDIGCEALVNQKNSRELSSA